jgi:hypothetical protein
MSVGTRQTLPPCFRPLGFSRAIYAQPMLLRISSLALFGNSCSKIPGSGEYLAIARLLLLARLLQPFVHRRRATGTPRHPPVSGDAP